MLSKNRLQKGCWQTTFPGEKPVAEIAIAWDWNQKNRPQDPILITIASRKIAFSGIVFIHEGVPCEEIPIGMIDTCKSFVKYNEICMNSCINSHSRPNVSCFHTLMLLLMAMAKWINTLSEKKNYKAF